MQSPVHIVDNPSKVERYSDVVLQLVRTQLAPLPEAPSQWVSSFDLHIVAPGIDAENIEDVLDDAADEVLQVLDRYEWVVWDKAERVSYEDGRAAYRVTLTLVLDSMAGAQEAPVNDEAPAPVAETTEG